MAKNFPVNLYKLAGMFVPQAGAAINDGDLKYVGQKGDALQLLAEIQAFCPNAVLGPPPFWPYQYISTDNGITDFWMISGTYSPDNGQNNYQLVEAAGYLADRATSPSPFIDRNPDGSSPGPNPALKFRIVAPPDKVNGYPGNIEVYWGSK